MDKDEIRKIRADIDATLKDIGEKHGLAFEVGRITYDDNGFKTRIEASVTGEIGESKIAIDFRNGCHKHGFAPEDLGRMFKNTNGTFKIVGLKPRNRKYPVIAKRLDTGRTYKFSALSVKMNMGLV